jgi:hypothetical protein
VVVTRNHGGGGAGRSALRAGLAAACTLLGVQAAPAQPVALDSALLFYKEPNRVSAVEALLEAKSEFGGGRSGSLKLVFDTLTGASANGATPAGRTQTFTGASGSSAYRAPAGETPLDDTFQDTRIALSGTYTLPLDRLSNLSFGADASAERDYTSLGANTSLTRDFFKRNTTLSAALSLSHDLVRPMGGRPVGFDVMAPPTSQGGGGDDDEGGGNRPGTLGNAQKNVMDVNVGVTQILDRRTLAQANYSFGRVNGYQTDPYKLLSVVNATTGDPSSYLYENRPDSRGRQALFGRLKHHFGWSVLDLSYRRYWDDWSVRSHTAELRLRYGIGAGYLEPHVRYYRQTAADFYQRYLLQGAALPDYASADYRLGSFTGKTVGLEYGRTLASGHKFTVRGEYYWQTGEGHPADAPAGLSGYDLFPTVDAMIVQVGYSFATR